MISELTLRPAVVRVALVGAAIILCLTLAGEHCRAAEPWPRHTIDDSSRGADGVRLADVNGDGHLDITTGWEEGGVIRVYLNPGPQQVAEKWPAVTVGAVKSPEDAVFADLDGDGTMDVVSSCEGRTRTMFFHWAPKSSDQYLNSELWKTEAVPCTANQQMWMFALPMDVDGRNGIDLIVSSKGENASIGWLESPADPRDVSAWKYHRLRDAGWVMSLVGFDMDNDGDLDVVASDRKGAKRGVLWLENPGSQASSEGAGWKDHSIGGTSRENMFLDVFSRRGNSPVILSAVKPAGLVRFHRLQNGGSPRPGTVAEGPGWGSDTIEIPGEKIGTGKSIRSADINLDGHEDLVYSCEQANGAKHGVVWLDMTSDGMNIRPISGPEGVKYDLIQLVDLDADGDLDVITCEERANLGVFWYENPSR
ncbi:MAG: VCBS repeat-containing protein [Rhodopirellula sp.]|nr:VCBS repeat-containing protein [Rhodopirellula sp.]